MSKKKRKHKTTAAKAPAMLQIETARVTSDLEKVIFGKELDSDFLGRYNIAYDLLQFAYKSVADMPKEKRRSTNVKVNVFDDEYLAWLDLSGRKNSKKSQGAYVKSLSNKDALRLLQKHNMDVSITVGTISFTLMYDRKPDKKLGMLVIPEEARLGFQAVLEHYFGEGNVWIPNWTMMPHTMEKYYDKLFSIGVSQLIEGAKIPENPFAYQRLQRSPLCLEYRLSIPFCVKWKTDTATFRGDIISTFIEKDGTIRIPAVDVSCVNLTSSKGKDPYQAPQSFINVMELDFYKKLGETFDTSKYLIDHCLVNAPVQVIIEKGLDKIFEDAARRSCTREDVANMADKLVFKGDKGPAWMNSIRLS